MPPSRAIRRAIAVVRGAGSAVKVNTRTGRLQTQPPAVTYEYEQLPRAFGSTISDSLWLLDTARATGELPASYSLRAIREAAEKEEEAFLRDLGLV